MSNPTSKEILAALTALQAQPSALAQTAITLQGIHGDRTPVIRHGLDIHRTLM